MQQKRIRQSWLLGAAAAAALFTALWLISDFRFENSDDGLLLRAFMGFEGGVPASFSTCAQPLLTWALCALGTAAPGVAWYSVYQLFVLLLSCAVMVKCMAQLANPSRHPLLIGGLAGGLLLLTLASMAACRVSFTTTAALAGAAGVAQALAAGEEGLSDGQILRRCLAGLGMLTLGYLLRPQSAWPSLAMMGVVLGWRLTARKQAGQSLKPLATALVCCLIALAALIGLRQWEIDRLGVQADLDWHAARTELMDYTAFESDPAPALAAGTSLPATEVELVRQWYFMDSAITTDALNRLHAAYVPQAKAETLPRLARFISENPRYLYMALMLFTLWALCWRGSARSAPWAVAAATAALLGTVFMLGYLAWRGRLLPRAADTVFFPCAVALAGFAVHRRATVPNGGCLRRAVAVALAVALLATVALQANEIRYAITRKPDTLSQQREADLETFALAHPDLLIARSPNLLRDTRLFPDVSKGIPANLILWGDWTCRTPSWYRQLERYGFDGRAFSASDWLSPGIALATAEPADTEALRAFLSDALGEPIIASPCGECGTLTFYQFQQPG